MARRSCSAPLLCGARISALLVWQHATALLCGALISALLVAQHAAASDPFAPQLEPFDLEEVALEGVSLHQAHAKLNTECAESEPLRL